MCPAERGLRNSVNGDTHACTQTKAVRICLFGLAFPGKQTLLLCPTDIFVDLHCDTQWKLLVHRFGLPPTRPDCVASCLFSCHCCIAICDWTSLDTPPWPPPTTAWSLPEPQRFEIPDTHPDIDRYGTSSDRQQFLRQGYDPERHWKTNNVSRKHAQLAQKDTINTSAIPTSHRSASKRSHDVRTVPVDLF